MNDKKYELLKEYVTRRKEFFDKLAQDTKDDANFTMLKAESNLCADILEICKHIDIMK